MSWLARSRRRLLLLFGLCALVLLLVRVLLNTPMVRQLVANDLGELLETNAHCRDIRIGMVGDTAVFGLTMRDDHEQPFLLARKVVVDLSLWSVLWGRRLPDRLDLEEVKLHLRFDPEGNLLTRLPKLPTTGQLPHLRLRDLTLILEQEGRAPFTVQGASFTLAPKSVENLSGLVEDPQWGQFRLGGEFGKGKLHLVLHSEGARVTTERFRSIPFLPRALTDRLNLTGTIPLRLDLWFGPEAPRSRYRVAFAQARARLHPPEGAPFEVRQVRGVVEGTEGKFDFSGSIQDPEWGLWNLSADQSPERPFVQLKLQSEEAVVDPGKLRTVPYVPGNVWNHIEAWGKTSVQVALRIAKTEPEVHYRIELSPRETRVRLPVLDFEATSVSGQVVVEDHRVLLRGVTGQSAGGRVSANGELDFRSTPSHLRFALSVQGVQLTRLPPSWELPRQLDGKVTGSAQLHLLAHADHTETRGTGTGRIDEATLAGFPTREPIRLSLRTEGNRFRLIPLLPVLQSLRRVTSRVGLPERIYWPVVALEGLARWIFPGESSYLTAQAELQDVELAELLRRMGVSLPGELRGPVRAQFELDIPVDHSQDLRGLRLRGQLAADGVRLEGWRLEEVQAKVRLHEGVVSLEGVRGKIAAGQQTSGSLHGRMQVQLPGPEGEQGELELKMRIEGCPIGPVGRYLGQEFQPVSGSLSALIHASVPLPRVGELDAWKTRVQVHAPEMEVAGYSARRVSAGLSLDKGQGRVEQLHAETLGGFLSGEMNLSVVEDRAFQAKLGLRAVDLAQLTANRQVQGTLTWTGELAGRLGTRTIGGHGTLRCSSLRVAQVPIDPFRATWSVDREQLEMKITEASVQGGAISGWLRVGLPAGNGNMELFVTDLDVKGLSRAGDPRLAGVEGKLTAQLSGSFRVGSPASEVKVRLDVASARLALAGIAVTNIRGKLDHAMGRTSYLLEGETLAGRLSLEGKYPPSPGEVVSEPHGWLRLDRLQVSRLIEALSLTDTLGGLRGVITISLPYRHDGPGLTPLGKGRFELVDLFWKGSEWIDLLRGEVHLGTEEMLLKDINGSFAGGTLRLSGGYRFAPGRGWFNLRLNRVDLGPLRLFDGDQVVQGLTDLTLRGTIGSEWRMSGAVSMGRGKVHGIEISDLHLPVEGSWIPATSHLELSVREATAQVGPGRARFRGTLRRTTDWRAEGQLHFIDASLRSLADVLGDVTSIARGRVTGKIDFSGAEMRSWSDLNANIHATLNDAQALQLPILRHLLPHVLPGNGGVEFQAGEMRGRLAGGVLRISELTLDSPLVLLVLQGSITLQGRLDLQVTAQTSTLGLNPLLLRLMLQPLPPIGPVPIGLIIRTTEALSDRVIGLRVSGTVRAPRVQVEPIRLLSEQAVRFFLTKAVKSAR